MDKIIALPQFEKLGKHRKNEKHQVLPPATPCYILQHHTPSCNTLLPPTTPFYLLQHRAATNRTTNTSYWLYEEPPVPTDDDDDEPSSGDFNADISDDLHS